jgi:L-rhamnose mutarotase
MMKRFGQVIQLKKGMLEEYTRYHAAVWPEVLKTISECGIRNYTIYHKDGWLFANFEYHGSNFEADSKKMGECPHTQKWWEIMMPMQNPVDFREEGEWWCTMDEVFHSA